MYRIYVIQRNLIKGVIPAALHGRIYSRGKEESKDVVDSSLRIKRTMGWMQHVPDVMHTQYISYKFSLCKIKGKKIYLEIELKVRKS